MDKVLTWVGPFDGMGAYPTINRQFTAALERAGWRVLRNQHNDGVALTPLCVVCQYPPAPPNVRHAHNVCLTTWEFGGPRGVPRSFAQAFTAFDVVAAMSDWVAQQFRRVTETPVQVVPLGIDPTEFAPNGGRLAIDGLPEGARVLVWVGGTDRRHGLDVAVRVMALLPDEYHLIAKQGSSYPANASNHPRVHVLRADLPSLAPLYRSAHLLLTTARGVGFHLPGLEALACGLPMVSTDLPPIREYAPPERVTFAEGGVWQPMGVHHLHDDCLPEWFEPDADALAATVLGFRPVTWDRDAFVQAWSWDAAARRLVDTVVNHAH